MQTSETFRGQKPDSLSSQLSQMIEAGDHEGVKKILDQKIDVNTVLDNGRPLLVHATIQQRPAIIAELIRQGADPVQTDHLGWNALQYAIDMNYIRGWILLDADKRIYENNQLLKFVTRRSSQKVMDQLQNGADPNWTDSDGETLLILAIRSAVSFPAAMSIVQILATWVDSENLNPIDLNLPGKTGEKPLLVARQLGLEQIVELLTGLGARE